MFYSNFRSEIPFISKAWFSIAVSHTKRAVQDHSPVNVTKNFPNFRLYYFFCQERNELSWSSTKTKWSRMIWKRNQQNLGPPGAPLLRWTAPVTHLRFPSLSGQQPNGKLNKCYRSKFQCEQPRRLRSPSTLHPNLLGSISSLLPARPRQRVRETDGRERSPPGLVFNHFTP